MRNAPAPHAHLFASRFLKLCEERSKAISSLGGHHIVRPYRAERSFRMLSSFFTSNFICTVSVFLHGIVREREQLPKLPRTLPAQGKMSTLSQEIYNSFLVKDIHVLLLSFT